MRKKIKELCNGNFEILCKALDNAFATKEEAIRAVLYSANELLIINSRQYSSMEIIREAKAIAVVESGDLEAIMRLNITNTSDSVYSLVMFVARDGMDGIQHASLVIAELLSSITDVRPALNYMFPGQ